MCKLSAFVWVRWRCRNCHSWHRARLYGCAGVAAMATRCRNCHSLPQLPLVARISGQTDMDNEQWAGHLKNAGHHSGRVSFQVLPVD